MILQYKSTACHSHTTLLVGTIDILDSKAERQKMRRAYPSFVSKISSTDKSDSGVRAQHIKQFFPMALRRPGSLLVHCVKPKVSVAV
jgi:hypothetical protein